MADQPNHSRDIRSDVLQVLARARRGKLGQTIREHGMSVRDIQRALANPEPSTTAIRDHLRVMASPNFGRWVSRLDRYRWEITDEGMRVAEGRGLVRRG
jgi:hypothetical protein